jgi:hypothetical protein
MTYTPIDLAIWTKFMATRTDGDHVTPEDGAQLIADVRREAWEEAAMEVKRLRNQWDILRSLQATHSGSALNEAIIAIRALRGGAMDRARLARIAGAVGFGDGTYMPDSKDGPK